MKRLAIDFAPRTLRCAVFRTHPLAWLIGCASIAVGLSAGFSVLDLSKQVDLDLAQLSHLQGKARDGAAAKPMAMAAKVSEGQANAVNNAIAQLNVPWRDVLDAVEGATPANIGLLALEPDARRNVVRGMAEARTSGDMIAYIEALRKQGYFDVVILTRHEVNELDPNKPLRFQFEARWRGEGR
jgi:Tfp pilus assembly protein PilN